MHLAILLSLALLWSGPTAASYLSLLDAARLGDADGVAARLASGDDPNSPAFSGGYAPLQFAAGNGHVEMTRLLLEAGADPDYRDHNGDRAILWAARRGHAETVGLLLTAGSPPDSDLDPYRQTPLMRAAGSGHAEIAYDGQGYAENPTVPPARRITDLAGAEIVIDDFDSFEAATPLPPQ